MKSSHHRVSNAKAIVSLLILGIAFVIFYKFMINQEYFFEDPQALRSYVTFSIIGGGLLLGLLYLSSQTEHKELAKKKAVSKSVKSLAKSTKKKKK